MTKSERLDGLMRAAESLQVRGLERYSCTAVEKYCGDSELLHYADVVDTSIMLPEMFEYDFYAQLARQLAVLMYREAVKRGEA